MVAGDVTGDGGYDRLGGGGDGRDRGPPGLHGGDPAALLEAIGQAAAELIAETVDEDDAFALGRGDGAGARYGPSRRWKRVRRYSSLERLGRLVQPGRVEMADGRRDHGFVLGWGKGESFTRAPVGLPAALGVNPRDVVRGGATDTLLGGRGEAGQRTKHLRERRASQPGPYPPAPGPVVLFELLNRPAGISLCEVRQLDERVVDGLLILLIQIRPAVAAFENEEATRPATPQHLRDPPELLGSLIEPRPHIAPPPLPLGEPCTSLHIGRRRRIEPEFAARLGAKGLPAPVVHLVADRLRVAHPAQGVAIHVHPDETVEVVRIEAAASEIVRASLKNLADRTTERLPRFRVSRDVKAGARGNPIRAKRQESAHTPVAPVGVVPDDAAEHELDEGAKCLRAVFPGAQPSTLDARQVDDGGTVGRGAREVDGAVDYATQPDGGACAVIGAVVTENEQLGDMGTSGGEQSAPLGAVVRPEDGGGGVEAAGRACPGADGSGKVVEGDCHPTRRPRCKCVRKCRVDIV